jgi:hypothetical protein
MAYVSGDEHDPRSFVAVGPSREGYGLMADVLNRMNGEGPFLPLRRDDPLHA